MLPTKTKGRISRRDFLRGAGAGAVVVGWNAASGSWVTAEAATTCSFEGLPPLDGLLLQDEASRSLAADDYGHVVRHTPCAVLRTTSVEDIVKIVRFARERGIKVSMRGQGHSSFGQAQVEGGVVIDSATLTRIHSIEEDRAVVDPGVLWRTLLAAAAARNVTPPVIADYQGLSVGGTLSLGGAASGPMPHGAQVDNVLEVRVVTGRGDLVTCSPAANRRLFNSVLAGLGQCGIIVRATLRMVPAPASALLVRLRYDDLDAHLEDISLLVRTRRLDAFDTLVGFENERWVYDLLGAAYFTPPDTPDSGALLKGLHDDRSQRVVAPTPYLAWASRFDASIAAGNALGAQVRYVISNPLVPEAAGRRFLRRFFSSHTPEDFGEGPIILFGLSRSNMRRPLLRVPDSEVGYGMQVQSIAQSDAEVGRALAASRRLYDRAVAVGGKRYPWDAVPDMTRADWRRHYGPKWEFLVRSKRRYDPANILGSGVGIFS